MNRIAPRPSTEQLLQLAREIAPNGDLRYVARLEGGLTCAMDVLEVRTSTETRYVVLRRYASWYAENGEDPGPGEIAALELARAHGVPAPEPVWIDRRGVFAEQAIVIGFIEGTSLLTPEDPLDWAEQLATALVAIHAIPADHTATGLFTTIRAGDEDRLVELDRVRIERHPLGRALWMKRRSEMDKIVPQPDVFLHADFWPGNTLWADQVLAAVVDWESCAVGDPGMDVAYCAMDMRYAGYGEAADHLVSAYREKSGRDLANLRYWSLSALCRPMPDIEMWVPAWNDLGLGITAAEARRRHHDLIQSALI